MLFQVKSNRLAGNPQLSRVWIKTGNPKLPLESVWFNDAKLRAFGSDVRSAERESESPELAEDHLVLAA